MDVQTLMEKKDSLTDKINNFITSSYDILMNFVSNMYEICSTSPSLLSIILWTISFVHTQNIMISTGCACAVYITSMIGQYTKNRIKRERIDSIDLEYIGLTLTTDSLLKKRSVTDLIGEYVEDCFNRDVIFFKPMAANDYISEQEQEEMLTSLLDSAAANMSSEVREKLSLYVGEDNLHKIIARKALSIITAFAATRNKAIYTKKPVNASQ